MSTARTYTVRVESGNPDLNRDDLDAAVRRAVFWMSNDIDPEDYVLSIEVWDEDGLSVTAHNYDPQFDEVYDIEPEDFLDAPRDDPE